MSKKVLAIVSGLFLVLGLAGCAGEEETNTPSEVPTVTVGYLIDNFEDGSDALCDAIDETSGSWYTWAEGAGASIDPVESAFCGAVQAEGGANETAGYLAVSGTAAGDGIGVGAYFEMNESTGEKVGRDFSENAGLVFWARGSATVRVSLNMPDFIPAGDEGGACDVGVDPNNCYNYHYKELVINSEEDWVEYTIPFDEFMQDDWGVENVALDATKIAGIHFNFPGTAGDIVFDLDEVGFYTAE